MPIGNSFWVWKVYKSYIFGLIAMEKNKAIDRTWRILKRWAMDYATTEYKCTYPSQVSTNIPLLLMLVQIYLSLLFPCALVLVVVK